MKLLLDDKLRTYKVYRQNISNSQLFGKLNSLWHRYLIDDSEQKMLH